MSDRDKFFFGDDNYPWNHHWGKKHFETEPEREWENSFFQNTSYWGLVGFGILVLMAVFAVCKVIFTCCYCCCKCSKKAGGKPNQGRQCSATRERNNGCNNCRNCQNCSRRNQEETNSGRNNPAAAGSLNQHGPSVPNATAVQIIPPALPNIVAPSAPPLQLTPQLPAAFPGHYRIGFMQNDRDYDPPPPYPGFS